MVQWYASCIHNEAFIQTNVYHASNSYHHDVMCMCLWVSQLFLIIIVLHTCGLLYPKVHLVCFDYKALTFQACQNWLFRNIVLSTSLSLPLGWHRARMETTRLLRPEILWALPCTLPSKLAQHRESVQDVWTVGHIYSQVHSGQTSSRSTSGETVF